MNNSLIIAYHAKHETKGWYEVCRYPIDSDQWTKQDRVFIDELLEIGDMVLTCGWNMWQVVKPV